MLTIIIQFIKSSSNSDQHQDQDQDSDRGLNDVFNFRVASVDHIQCYMRPHTAFNS